MDIKLTPEGEAIAAYGTATMAAIKLLIICLEANGTLQPGEYADAVRAFTEKSAGAAEASVVAILQDLRLALLN